MACLTTAGLVFDAIGAILLVGPEFRAFRNIIRRTQPTTPLLNWLVQSMPEERPVPATNWKIRPIVWLINTKRRFTLNLEIDSVDDEDKLYLERGILIVEYDQLSYYLDNPSEITEPEDTGTTAMRVAAAGQVEYISLSEISNHISDVEDRWMYLAGLILLTVGFILQLIGQITTDTLLRPVSIQDLDPIFYTDVMCLFSGLIAAVLFMWVLSLAIFVTYGAD